VVGRSVDLRAVPVAFLRDDCNLAAALAVGADGGRRWRCAPSRRSRKGQLAGSELIEVQGRNGDEEDEKEAVTGGEFRVREGMTDGACNLLRYRR
jgi:hypothetical protein